MPRRRVLVVGGVLLVAAVSAAWQWFPVQDAPPVQRLVRVGLYENPPKVYTTRDGRPAGLFVELLDAMAGDERWRLQYVPCEWADCLRRLEAGRLDLMPDAAFSVARDRRFDFHDVSVASSWSQVYARRDLDVRSVEDLAGRRVAILEGGIQQEFFAQLMAGSGYRYRPVPVASLERGYEAVVAGDADAVVTNSFYAAHNGRQTVSLGSCRHVHDSAHHLVCSLFLHLVAGFPGIGDPDACIKQAQKVVDLSNRSYRRAWISIGRFLVDGYDRRQAVDKIHFRSLHHTQELPGIS